MVEQLFRNNFKIYILLYLLHFRFSKKDKKIGKISQLFWRVLNKLQVTWEFSSNVCGLLKKSELYKADFFLHYIIVLQDILCQIDLFFYKLNQNMTTYFPGIYMNCTCFQCKLSYNDYINHSDAPVYATAMTTMGQFNEWHFPLLLCMLHTCQNICGKSRELKHWRKKD